jgi:ADP-dependent NAD(P)H-hydrate dehydratase / NAD(P)H-hydrate epimerase
MLPILTPKQLQAYDAAAGDVETLIRRAGEAVARHAVAMMGGTYGRTVDVIAGPGHNGDDGRVAAALLTERGVRVRIHRPDDCPASIHSDLVIDAAFGTGFRGSWTPPDVGDTPVLAVDVPSGVNASTGQIDGAVLSATRTVTFAATKFGVLNPPGSDVCGEVHVVDVGPPVTGAQAHVLEADDVRLWWPVPFSDAHKWRTALRVVAGSATMPGAAELACSAAIRAGAGMVQVSSPGTLLARLPVEVVQQPLPMIGWSAELLSSMDRFHAMVIGPGLGREPSHSDQIRHAVVGSPVPTVVDGDGLFALGWNALGAAALVRDRPAATVLTPHDGEYALLAGAPPDPDRIVAARRLAADANCIVLLKGPATVVADPDGRALVVTTGDVRLATAGTGDVLAGLIGRLLAGGVAPFEAAAVAAWVHGSAAARGRRIGFVAGDLPALVADLLSELL